VPLRKKEFLEEAAFVVIKIYRASSTPPYLFEWSVLSIFD
jgi:hypothetical protein